VAHSMLALTEPLTGAFGLIFPRQRARSGLADPCRRLAKNRRCTGGASDLLGRDDRARPTSLLDRRAGAEPSRAVRSHPAAAA
jgi:hypothetical protein